METGGGEPQKRLAKMKKRCFLIPADYNNMVSNYDIFVIMIAKSGESECTNMGTK